MERKDQNYGKDAGLEYVRPDVAPASRQASPADAGVDAARSVAPDAGTSADRANSVEGG
jgi:hypothetical protein